MKERNEKTSPRVMKLAATLFGKLSHLTGGRIIWVSDVDALVAAGIPFKNLCPKDALASIVGSDQTQGADHPKPAKAAK